MSESIYQALCRQVSKRGNKPQPQQNTEHEKEKKALKTGPTFRVWRTREVASLGESAQRAEGLDEATARNLIKSAVQLIDHIRRHTQMTQQKCYRRSRASRRKVEMPLKKLRSCELREVQPEETHPQFLPPELCHRRIYSYSRHRPH